MFSKVMLTNYSPTLWTFRSWSRLVFKLHTFSRTCSTFKRFRKVVKMFFSKSSPFESFGPTGISFSRLSSSRKCFGDLFTSFIGRNVSCSRNVRFSGNFVLTRSELTRIFLTADTKGIERPEHFNSTIALNHLSEQPMTYKVFSGSKRNKVNRIIATAKTFWNNMMSFGVSFSKGSPTMFNNLIVPAMVFVWKKGSHMFIYQTTCMRRT